MPSIGLYDNFVGPFGSQGTGSFNYELGLAFSVTATVNVTGIKHYTSSSSGTGSIPSQVTLWDGVTHAQIVRVGTVAPTVAGWQSVFFPSAVNLQANYPYVISATYPTGRTFFFQGQQMVLDAPLEWDAIPTRTAGNNPNGAYPGSSWGNTWLALDVIATTSTVTPPPGGTITQSGLVAGLDSYLNVNVHDHDSDGYPALTKLAVDLVKTGVDSANISISTIQGDVDGIVTNLAATENDVLTLINDIATPTKTVVDALFTWVGGVTKPGGQDDVVTMLNAIIAQLAIMRAELDALAQPPAPGAWVSQGTTTFDTAVAWGQEADVYTITFSDLGAGRVNSSLDGVDVSYRLAWWSPWNGSAARDRRFIDFPTHQAYDGGRRMPGIYLLSPQGATGTIEAFTYQ